MRKRVARLNEQLKRELAELIRGQVRDPRIGLVTVTEVRVAPDLTTARVYVRVLGDEAERAESIEGLFAAAPFLRRTLGRALHVRRIPELRFEEDRTLEQALRIERILSEVVPEDGEDASPDEDAEEEAPEAGPEEPEGDEPGNDEW